MRRIRLPGALLACSALLLSCEPAAEEEVPAEERAMEEEGEAALSAADLAGTWTVTAFGEAGDSLVTYELRATGDPSAWTIVFPERDPVPVRVVAIEGDSVVTEAGPYQSVLREGVSVTTHQVARLEGDRLVGTFVARYETTEADSVVRGRVEGTRQP